MITFAVLAAASALVAGEPWRAAPPPSHLPPKVMGRDYWTFFHEWRYSHPLNELKGAWDNPAVANLPMFRDCGLVYYSGNLSLPPGKGTWRKVAGNFGNGVWERFESVAKTNCPATMLFHPKCRYTPAMAGEIDLDYDDYAAWKARHPNLVSVRFQSEWGVDLVQRMLNRKREKDPAARAVLEAAWNRWSWTNRYDRLEQARWYMERHIDLNYGDMPMFESFRSANFLDHMAAARGASTLVSETTNTSDWNSEYRWDVSSMFIRGAARQFGGLPWHWFVAGFFNGPCKDGTWANDSHCSAGSRFGLAGGTSDSLERRVAYFAYLSGAGAVEPESWQSNFFVSNAVSGKMELSARGRNFSNFHDFTAAHPGRGATYAPVAILVPVSQGYHTCGGKAWGFCPYTTPDHMVDAIFFTIAPGFDRRKVLAEGWERNLHNSPFALMYDVLVPDTQQSQKDFLAALGRYPVAVLSGRYRPEDYAKFAMSLDEYVRGGGTLVVNAAHVRDGMFASLAGLVSATKTFRCANTAVDDEGATFQVSDAYDCAELSPRGGDRVLVKDGEGRPLVVASCVGKGRVVTAAPLWLVPQIGEKGGDGAVHLTRTGRRRFPFVENLLSRLQRELFPVSVEGSAQFGLNRTAEGWWLWCFNNHGVRKFADAPQEIDHAQDSRLRIDVSRLGDVSCRELLSGKTVAAPGSKFGWTLPAGDLAVFELRRPGGGMSRPERVEIDASEDRVETPLRVPLRRSGTLRPRSTREIRSSNWTLGCECSDRDLVDFDGYRRFLAPLGIKVIRIQGGWQKCEKVKGVYDFAWLDHIVDAAAEDGMSCYLDTEYGNTNYCSGGVDLGAKFPEGDEALRGWDNWVDALSKHFKGRVRDWSMWNEPWCSPAEIISNNVRTARIIKRNIPDARIGALSLGDCRPARIEACVREMGADKDLFTWVVYHGYTYAPEQRYEDVVEIRGMLDRLFPSAILRQGENGCPSESLPHGWVLNAVPWSEYSQAKWIMRRMLGDLGHDVLCGIFQIVDFYNPKRKIVDGVTNTKGLLRTNRAKQVIGIKMAYYAVQNTAAVFDDRWTRVRDSKFATTDPGIATYEYVKDSGERMYAFWRFDDPSPYPIAKVDSIEKDKGVCRAGVPVRPGDSFETAPQVFKVADGRRPLRDPVWVDLFSGRVYDLPGRDVSDSPDAVYYMHVPVYDSPCLLVERSALDLM